jgi:hypothetical protein
MGGGDGDGADDDPVGGTMTHPIGRRTFRHVGTSGSRGSGGSNEMGAVRRATCDVRRPTMTTDVWSWAMGGDHLERTLIDALGRMSYLRAGASVVWYRGERLWGCAAHAGRHITWTGP